MESEGSYLPGAWRSSTYSHPDDCVECRSDRGRMLVRDSKNADGGVLSVPDSGWTTFIASLA